MPTFIAHRLSSTVNVVFPDKIDISRANVTFYKATPIGYTSTVIPRNNIASVSIQSKLLFADVVLETLGGKRVEANGFKKEDGRRILDLLT